MAGISNGNGGPALLGRIRVYHVLDRLLESERAGQRRVLVLRGESGAGKPALLELLIAAAEPQPTPGRGGYGSLCVLSRALRVT